MIPFTLFDFTTLVTAITAPKIKSFKKINQDTIPSQEYNGLIFIICEENTIDFLVRVDEDYRSKKTPYEHLLWFWGGPY